jgi:hypothetical protein
VFSFRAKNRAILPVLWRTPFPESFVVFLPQSRFSSFGSIVPALGHIGRQVGQSGFTVYAPRNHVDTRGPCDIRHNLAGRLVDRSALRSAGSKPVCRIARQQSEHATAFGS